MYIVGILFFRKLSRCLVAYVGGVSTIMSIYFTLVSCTRVTEP